MERIGLPDGCLLGLKIDRLAYSWLAGGLGTHMGSIGKQVPLPLHHHYATGAGAGCHDLLLKLSPTQPLPPPFGWVYTTDLVQNPSYIDQCRPYPTGPLGPISVTFQPMAKTPVGSGPARLRDRRAFQDHVAIM